MKKLYAHFALFGMLAGLLGASYAMPASAAVTDEHTAYAGDTTVGTNAAEAYVYEYYYVYCDDYIYYYRYEYGAVDQQALGSTPLVNAASDQIFDQ
jgi:hypothetical protein